MQRGFVQRTVAGMVDHSAQVVAGCAQTPKLLLDPLGRPPLLDRNRRTRGDAGVLERGFPRTELLTGDLVQGRFALADRLFVQFLFCQVATDDLADDGLA